MNDSSSDLTSTKKTRSLNNLFVFKEPEKSLKKTPLGLFHNEGFYKYEKNQKRTQTFDAKFGDLDQIVLINAQRLFIFYGSTKKSKTNFQNFYCYRSLSCNELKNND